MGGWGVRGWGWVDIEKVLVSNKISFGEKNCKYFIGYFYNDHKVKQLHIMLTKTSVYVKTKWIYFLIKDDDLLEKYDYLGQSQCWYKKNNLIASQSMIKNFWKPK